MKVNNLHSLIPLADFKAVLGIDDREDTLSRYCLVTATYSIEQFCMRRLLQKKYFERIEYTGDLLLQLRKSIVESASWIKEMNITNDQLDTNPWLINVKNGTIDIQTGEFREHRQSDYHQDCQCGI